MSSSTPQITYTLTHRLAGADRPALLDALSHSNHPRLAAAAGDGAWLVTLAAQLAETDATSVDPAIERVLADVAGYRHRWTVTGPLPLGDGAIGIDQANERRLLTLGIDHAAGADTELGDPWGTAGSDRTHGTPLPELDDTLGW